MRRGIPGPILAATLATAALGGPAPGSEDTLAMVERCMALPGACKVIIIEESNALASSREVCIPPGLTSDQMSARVMATVQEAVETAPESFTNLSFRLLARQIVTVLWPCER